MGLDDMINQGVRQGLQPAENVLRAFDLADPAGNTHQHQGQIPRQVFHYQVVPVIPSSFMWRPNGWRL